MPDTDLVDVRARAVSANALDAVRPLARRHGYRHTLSDLVRFAVELAAEISRRANQSGTAPGFPEDFQWPCPKQRGQSHPGQQLRPGSVRPGVDDPGAIRVEFP